MDYSMTRCTFIEKIEIQAQVLVPDAHEKKPRSFRKLRGFHAASTFSERRS